MHKIALALGANVGDLDANLDTALELLGQKIGNIRESSRIRTKAAYYEDQDDFLNSAVIGTTDLNPTQLLAFTQTVEQKVGRKRRFQYGPREVDVDILLFDDLVVEQENLSIPHSLMHERDFVLRPLAQIAPDWMHPKIGSTIAQLLEKLG